MSQVFTYIYIYIIQNLLNTRFQALRSIFDNGALESLFAKLLTIRTYIYKYALLYTQIYTHTYIQIYTYIYKYTRFKALKRLGEGE